MWTRQSRNVNKIISSIHCFWHCSCRNYFCCFSLAIANISLWSVVPFLQIFFVWYGVQRNTVKISFSCMRNLKQKIDGHNKSTLRKTNAVPPKACNCRQPAHCPLDGNCLKSAVIYQATVATEDNRRYVGLTENSFKTRYSNHKSSFRDPNKRLSAKVSKHIWHLKDAKINIGFSSTWKILKQAAAPFNRASNRCNLCIPLHIDNYAVGVVRHQCLQGESRLILFAQVYRIF